MKDIIQLSTGSSNVLLVSLPEGANDFQLFNGNQNTFLLYRPVKKQGFLPVNRQKMELPPGNWIEVGWSDSLTEEQVKGLFKSKQRLGHEYFLYKHMTNIYYTAIECWQCFLSANNIKERKFVLRDNNK